MSEVKIIASDSSPAMDRPVRFFVGRRIADIRDVDDSPLAQSLEYKPCLLHHGDRDHPWECLIATHESNKDVKYFKPTKAYTEYEFEHFFSFGRKCSGFSPDRIVRYTPRVWP